MQEGKGKTDKAPLPLAFLQRLGILQFKDALARQFQEQLGPQSEDPKAKKTSRSQWQGRVIVRDTQPPTPLTVRDALKESRLPVTSNNLQSNRYKPQEDNSAQKAPSTPKGEEPEEEALGAKSEEPRAGTPRTQSAKTAAERCSKGRDNIMRWHEGLEEILCHNKKVYVP